MGLKVPPGLIKRGDTWHVSKIVNGCRIRESTGTGDLAEAQRYLAFRMEQVRNAVVYGVRPKRTFREAATKYLRESMKRSLDKDAWCLKRIDPFIGDLYLENVHMGTVRPYIDHGRKMGWKARTINMPLEVVRHILNLAAGEWLDENGLTWLQAAPKIRLIPRSDARSPYPLAWAEQERLFGLLPQHLIQMSLFAVNTGLRNLEVCGLRWDYEIKAPEIETSVFILPGDVVKNKQDRLVVLNSVAKSVIEEVRDQDPVWVFTYKGSPVRSMYNTAWKDARVKANLPFVRVHDLKHTYGRRLRAAGVSLEDRQDLLGHKSSRITTHYSAPELINLIEASERVCATQRHKSDTMVILRQKNRYLRVV
ncbi:tyrosine-type recombinase/integrase [Candidatus Magnetobacterium casense]|uniref:Tyrosine-type recombinase/integrase n=1 Tax=Candidatus Magnetobacterium casense TaxID=1455061 RepID=A0ABS6S0C7_9BACT|nr:tyrosine-type recombinase/integrase [Candidatus Magnetobacterium casensis]MBV6342317.1 tyrosine-type recombinase/integrase [Candidatus Magnetobacterium casensis]